MSKPHPMELQLQQQKERIAALESERDIYRDNEMKACKYVDKLEAEKQAREQLEKDSELLDILRADTYYHHPDDVKSIGELSGQVGHLTAALKLAKEALRAYSDHDFAKAALAEIQRMEGK